MIRAIDISNHQGVPKMSTMLAWKDAGYEHLIVRLSLERASMIDIAHSQLRNGADAGLTLAGYVWAYPRVEDPDTLAQRALDVYGRDLLCYWIDLEDDEGWAYDNPNDNIVWTAAALKSFDIAGVRTGVYSGPWWWNRYVQGMAGTPAFSRYPLWEANYVNYTPDAPGMATFGGWDQRQIWQHSSKAFIAGVGPLDVNVVDDVWLYGAQPPAPEVPVTDEQMAEVKRIAQEEIIVNIEKALKTGKLPAVAREALRYGALPAAQTLARGLEPE